MYCNNCGKEVVEGSAFCTWCGAKQDVVAQPINESAGAVQAGPEQSVFAGSVPPVSGQATADPDMQQPGAAQEQSGTDGNVPPVQQTSHGVEMEVPLGLEENVEKPKKYYTAAHLAICLVVTGVMAAVAGVFAGLYFSVI
ncbi:MAG: zinc ribbon domain-containing protein [Oscillospiraceae bacterium]